MERVKPARASLRLAALLTRASTNITEESMAIWKDYAPLFPVLPALATLIVGFAAVFIAWQQRRLAQNSLRLGLFDRRYRIFEITRDFLSAICDNSNFDNSHVLRFNADVSGMRLLFGPDVIDYLSQIR
jgi:hypothetical protein